MDLTDAMNSSLNRGREVFFVVKNGTSTIAENISRNTFRFNSNAPMEGAPNRSEVLLTYPVIIAPGQEKAVSIWLDGLEYVIGGSLSLSLKGFVDSGLPQIRGNAAFTISR